jgi:hypothetical protein
MNKPIINEPPFYTDDENSDSGHLSQLFPSVSLHDENLSDEESNSFLSLQENQTRDEEPSPEESGNHESVRWFLPLPDLKSPIRTDNTPQQPSSRKTASKKRDECIRTKHHIGRRCFSDKSNDKARYSSPKRWVSDCFEYSKKGVTKKSSPKTPSCISRRRWSFPYLDRGGDDIIIDFSPKRWVSEGVPKDLSPKLPSGTSYRCPLERWATEEPQKDYKDSLPSLNSSNHLRWNDSDNLKEDFLPCYRRQNMPFVDKQKDSNNSWSLAASGLRTSYRGG